MAAADLLAAVAEGPSRDGAGSGDWGVGSRSVPEARCDEGKAVAACVGMGWSVGAGTGVWGRAEESALGWRERWAEPGPADGGVGTAVEDS